MLFKQMRVDPEGIPERKPSLLGNQTTREVSVIWCTFLQHRYHKYNLLLIHLVRLTCCRQTLVVATASPPEENQTNSQTSSGCRCRTWHLCQIILNAHVVCFTPPRASSGPARTQQIHGGHCRRHLEPGLRGRYEHLHHDNDHL